MIFLIWYLCFYDEDIQQGIFRYDNSVIGRPITDKTSFKSALHHVNTKAWGYPNGFKTEEMANKTFKFFMNNEQHTKKILRCGIRISKNSWMLVNPWCRGWNQNTWSSDFHPIVINTWLTHTLSNHFDGIQNWSSHWRCGRGGMLSNAGVEGCLVMKAKFYLDIKRTILI